MTEHTDIRESVRVRYAAVPRATSCSAPTCYEPAAAEGAPAGAVAASLGCGVPTGGR